MNRARIEEMRQIAKLQKAIKEETKKVLPSIYASLAKVLFDKKGMTGEEIAEIFSASQDLWAESIEHEETLLEWCEKTTGIKLTSDEFVG